MEDEEGIIEKDSWLSRLNNCLIVSFSEMFMIGRVDEWILRGKSRKSI